MVIKACKFRILIETSSGLPGGLVLLFRDLRDFGFIYSGEGKGYVVFAVSIKFAVVFSYVLSQLFFLELPNIEFLARVLKDLYVWRQINSGLR